MTAADAIRAAYRHASTLRQADPINHYTGAATMKPHHDNGKPDTRYTVTLEHTGHHQAQYVARFLADRIGAGNTPRDAWELCCDHQRERFQIYDLVARISAPATK